MNYLYGKLNKELERIEYSGEDTETIDINIDNENNIIKANVIRTPKTLIINDNISGEKDRFNGVYDVSIEIPRYELEQEEDPIGNMFVYDFKLNGDIISKIQIPYDKDIFDIELDICVEDDNPIEGLQVGDPYLKITIEDGHGSSTYKYISLAGLVYKAGDSIKIENNIVSINLQTGSLSDKFNTIVDSIQHTQDDINAHIFDTNNPHDVTKSQIKLGNVDNTSDIDKPVSTAQAAAIQHVQNKLDEQCGDIRKVIPNQASAENQLADKDFVNSSIQNMAAFYITKDAAGNPFATYAELIAGPYYFQGKIQPPSINDYAIVLKDESQTPDALGQYPTTRYSYDGVQWDFQYIVNNTSLTSEQVAAINSGITKEIVDKAKTAVHFQNIATFSIVINDWVAADDINPFKFKATKIINTDVTVKEDSPMSISFDDLIASIGIAVANIIGTSTFTVVFYAVMLPTTTITGTLGGTL